MVWANVLVLGLGGALLTLPVVLHFLMQPKPKLIEFPALRFVQKRQYSNSSRMRLRHILLMLLRCLLILLMAAALAGPSVASREFGQWIILAGVAVSGIVVALALATVAFATRNRNRLLIGVLGVLLVGHLAYGAWAGNKLLRSESAQLIGDSAAPVTALIVVDNSCRMDYQYENKTNLERAKELGRWLIEQLPSDSQACVILTDDDIPFYSVDLGAARNRIDNLDIEFTSRSIPNRIAEGLKLLEEAIHERRELYILTDMTKKSWEAENSTVMKMLENEQSLSVFVLDVGKEKVENFSLSPISLSRESLTQEGELLVSTHFHRAGSGAQRSVRFRLERPDKSRPAIRDRKVLIPDQFIERTKVVDVPSNGSSKVEFKFSEKISLGTHHGHLEIVGDDALSHDNVRHFTIEVREAWDVLVIHGDRVVPDNLTEALIDDAEKSLFNCTVLSQQKMPSDFAKYDAVFLLDPDSGISDTTWALLRQYIADGHGLGIFLGANAADGPFGHASFKTVEAQKILTGSLNRQWRRPNSDLFLSPENLTHPIFAPFREWETAIPWYDFPIFVHWSIEPDDLRHEYPTKTILQMGNGMPAIIERQIGSGRVLVMTTPITESAQMEGRSPWNALFIDLPVPAWLLVRQISEYLVQSQTDSLNLEIGQMASLKNDYRKHPKQYRIFTPRTTHTPEKIEAVEGTLKYRFTRSPGQYRLTGSLDTPVQRGFSVNLGNGQTDLQRIENSGLELVLGAGRYQLAKRKEEIQRQQGATRRGQEFYPLLLLMLIVVLGVEYLMSNRFYS